MRLLKTTKLKVKRYGEQAINDVGDIVVSAAGTFTIDCNWQPVPNVQKGEIASVLPSGVQITDVVVLFTRSELRVDDESKSLTGDEVEINGSLYKVHQERDWSRFLSIKHREYLLIKKVKR